MMFVEILIGGRSFEQINIMCISENTSFNDGMNLGLLIESYFPAHGTVKWRDTDFPKTLSLVLKTM